jgi:ubiquinone/menaquinone biosynthesis C-methylase UbiE
MPSDNTQITPWAKQPLGRRVSDFFRFVSLLFIPSRRRVSTLYDLISTTNYFTERTMFRNLGYWRDAPETLDDACEAMARLAGETAALGPNDRVLDCGFGFGDQDMFWAEQFKPREIVGLNVTQSQIDIAVKRVAERGLSDRVKLQQGSATQLEFPAGSFDKVIALESAFHFDTREDFFREAFRVLKPGGRLVTLDMIPMPGLKTSIWLRLGLAVGFQLWQMNAKNLYDRNIYAQKLTAAGFQNARCDSINEHVAPHFTRFVIQKFQDPETAKRFNPAVRWMFHPTGVQHEKDLPKFSYELDYVLSVADKPRA